MIPKLFATIFIALDRAIKEERVAASRKLRGPAYRYTGSRKALIDAVQQALYLSKICSYAQGFALMRAAEREFGWRLKFGEIARIWRGGCIIRARFLQKIRDAYDRDRKLPNLMLDPHFRRKIHAAQDNWRNVVALAARAGIPSPAFASALAYYDSYRSARLPANLLQAQRDYFGAHTYERTDREGTFHTDWQGLRRAPRGLRT